ncbi:unnamed protein product [Pedinophyceae sp. YPF-701]|nr:unnamed protein product [Pedinophyceae sp. YPF-701]
MVAGPRCGRTCGQRQAGLMAAALASRVISEGPTHAGAAAASCAVPGLGASPCGGVPLARGFMRQVSGERVARAVAADAARYPGGTAAPRCVLGRTVVTAASGAPASGGWLTERIFNKDYDPPMIVERALELEDAKKAFLGVQGKNWLHPAGLLKPSDPCLRTDLSLLPFLCFDFEANVTVRVVRGRAGRSDPAPGATVAPGRVVWEEVACVQLGRRSWPWHAPESQVYASYKLRRDLAEAARLPGNTSLATASNVLVPPADALDGAQRLTAKDCWPWNAAAVQAGASATVGPTDRDVPRYKHMPLDPPDMSEGVAFELMLRRLRASIAKAHAAVMTESDSEEGDASVNADAPARLEEVLVDFTDVESRCRYVLLPAYRLRYSFLDRPGEVGERKAQEFEAMIGAGAPNPSVVCERHVCPRKAGVAAAGAVGSLGVASQGLTGAFFAGAGEAGEAAAAVAASNSALASTGESVVMALQTLGVEGGILAAFAALVAGTAARQFTSAHRRMEEQRREVGEGEAVAMYSVAAGATGGAGGAGDAGAALEHDAAVARNEEREWRRWEEAGRWRWDSGRRGAWAEDILKRQRGRREARARFMETLEREAQRAAEAEQREVLKRLKYGPRESGALHGSPTAGMGRGVADPQGLYAALGLSPSAEGGPSFEEVKAAFRRAALEYHPDVASGDSVVARGPLQGMPRADAFRRVQAAYRALRDPRLRELYDSGVPVGGV